MELTSNCRCLNPAFSGACARAAGDGCAGALVCGAKRSGPRVGEMQNTNAVALPGGPSSPRLASPRNLGRTHSRRGAGSNGIGIFWFSRERGRASLRTSGPRRLDAVVTPSRPQKAELFTLRESPPAHCKTATFAKCTAYRELSVCALCLSTGGQRERRLRSRARRRRRRRRRQESISRLLRSFALGASCKPLGAIVGLFWGHTEAPWVLLGLSRVSLRILLGFF